MDEKQLMKFKVPELKEKLLALGIQPKGLKADLVRQLLQAFNQNNFAQQQQYFEAPQQQFIESDSIPIQHEMGNPFAPMGQQQQTFHNSYAQVQESFVEEQQQADDSYVQPQEESPEQLQPQTINDSQIQPQEEQQQQEPSTQDCSFVSLQNKEQQPKIEHQAEEANEQDHEDSTGFEESNRSSQEDIPDSKQPEQVGETVQEVPEKIKRLEKIVEADENEEVPTIDEAELAKMTKNQRRKYKKKIRNKVKRIERNAIETTKKKWLAETLEQQRLIEEKLKLEEKKAMEREKSMATTFDDEDRMDIDEEDEAEDEKEKRRKLEEEIMLKRIKEEEQRERERENILKQLENEVEIEYVPEEIPKDAFYLQYLKVFDKFSAVSASEASRLEAEQSAERYKNRDDRSKMLELKMPVELELKDDDENNESGSRLSKRKMKQMMRMNISVLKQQVSHPELVEMHDITAKEPVVLLNLKSTRNTVPVPRHWCYKRKYLQGKRGFEKPPFKLPEFIRRTGIQEMREAVQEKEDTKNLKNKMREKIRPKMGKIDIDYQKLHDAFFKWQTKPKMTIHGDLYYEGKEFETRLKDKKPGDLSNEVRAALGMPTGPNAHKCPPPWLIAMQRYGPPPSYPNLKIAGLNAPIPEACSFGYHAGGWGKPPVDEYGRPLYGDVFGQTGAGAAEMHILDEVVDQSRWGELDEEDDDDESEEEEEEGGDAENADRDAEAGSKRMSGTITPALGHEGLATPSGISTTGLETPDLVELRKRKQIEAEMESGDNPQLFTVVPEKKQDKFGKDMMGSMHVYDFASLSKSSSSSATKSSRNNGVEVTLDPSDLESGQLDSHQMEKRYEQTLRAQSGGNPHEDLSDMVAEYNAKKRKKDSKDKSKKHQFKF